MDDHDLETLFERTAGESPTARADLLIDTLGVISRRDRRRRNVKAGLAVSALVLGGTSGAALWRNSPDTPTVTDNGGSNGTNAVYAALPLAGSKDDPPVTCRAISADAQWTPSVMADGLSSGLDRDQLREALNEIAESPAVADEGDHLFPGGVDKTAARVLSTDEDATVVGLGPWTSEGPQASATFLKMRQTNGQWSAVTFGTCNLQLVLDKQHAWADFKVEDTDPKSTSLSMSVTESGCTSGRDPQPFLDKPVLVEDETSVTIYWTSARPEGAQNCQANPAVSETVTLKEPLGSRVVRDGSVYPPSAR